MSCFSFFKTRIIPKVPCRVARLAIDILSPVECFAIRKEKTLLSLYACFHQVHVAGRPKKKGRKDSFGIPGQIWKGNSNFQTRAAFHPPKYNLKSRSLASAIDLIPKVMNFSSEKKIALAPVIKSLKDVTSNFWFI